jgi:hypothetical protein
VNASRAFVEFLFLCVSLLLSCFNPKVLPARLDVDLVQPNLLLGSGGVGADSENVLHLLVTDEEDVSGDEESDSLVARGGGQRACRDGAPTSQQTVAYHTRDESRLTHLGKSRTR